MHENRARALQGLVVLILWTGSHPCSPMTQDKQKQQRVDYACSQLTLGVDRATLALLLQRRLQLSRATAYRVIGEAEAYLETQYDPDGSEACAPPDANSLLGVLHSLLMDAAAANDVPAVCKLSREIDRVNARCGRVTVSTQPLQPLQ